MNQEQLKLFKMLHWFVYTLSNIGFCALYCIKTNDSLVTKIGGTPIIFALLTLMGWMILLLFDVTVGEMLKLKHPLCGWKS